MDEQQIKNRFGEVLRALRTKQGLSQEQLALDSGLDRSYISMLERGKRQPSLTTIFVIAENLNVAPSKIVRLVEFTG
jgi:transcriptional regulator with XRE-family HTH domain